MNTENNKIIAEFMCYKIQKDPTERFFGRYRTPITKVWVKETELCFHSDWNWLMEVVGKIENLKSDVIIQGNSFGYICNIRHFKGVTDVEFKFQGSSKTAKMEAVYNACIKFIKWYNENK
jgi:hypothetical protein